MPLKVPPKPPGVETEIPWEDLPERARWRLIGRAAAEKRAAEKRAAEKQAAERAAEEKRTAEESLREAQAEIDRQRAELEQREAEQQRRHAAEEQPKRGPGRPATGVVSVSRSVSLPQEYWDWIAEQFTAGMPTRSHVIRAILDKARAKK